MNINLVLNLLGGLALFLYGMQMMSNGLEAAAGNKMKIILERLTSNRFLGVAAGAVITAVIQSSSATTVMVVGFVNSGLMTLNQAVWIIMGANIGTTVTGQLIALDVGALAPLFAFAGVAMIVFSKRISLHNYGHIIAGLGVLFIGMEMMGNAMLPLRDSQGFINLMTKFTNPLAGIAAGAIFTAIIQSSSASVGILQALACSGLTDLSGASFVLFGQNIGTCITAILASIGTSQNAKRTTVIHLMFNIIGTAVFTVLCISTPLTLKVSSLTPENPAAQIANMHTLFNIVTTILLLPFGGFLANLAQNILPARVTVCTNDFHLQYITPNNISNDWSIGNSAIIISNIKNELRRMLEMTRRNVNYSFSAVLKGAALHLCDIEKSEEYVDYLNKEISKYIAKIIASETNTRDSATLGAFIKISGNLERISDHAINICGYAQILDEKHSAFSAFAQDEIAEMREISMYAIDLLGTLGNISSIRLSTIAAAKQQIDDMTSNFRKKHLQRLQNGQCHDETCILYSEMLTDFERIGDHVLNIGQELASESIPC